MSDDIDLTRVIRAAGNGDSKAREDAARLVYDELRQGAQRMMHQERQVTLQPTALVNEALMRLLDDDAVKSAPDRNYFFAAASHAMRRILVDEARRRKSLKRGGNHNRQPFDDLLDRYASQNLDLLTLEEALQELENLHSRQAKVVELRWFMEFTVKEIAEMLDISVSTVEQDWRSARAYLRKRMGEAD